MPVAKEQIRQIISENNITSVADVYSLLRDSFKNLLKVYNQKNSGYTKSRRKIRQQKIPKIDSKFLHIELLSREAWTSKDTRFLTLSCFFSFFRLYSSDTSSSIDSTLLLLLRLNIFTAPCFVF